MRKVLCNTLVEQAGRRDFVFLTGDLGFQALEPLREVLGPRFINAGVAEQNMISVAAGLAATGHAVWAYSIAPFLYSRPFEQIRNDVCMHDLPVRLAGNGGGYAYGAMGGTHHALEDYGALLTLPNMHAFVPVFAADVPDIIERLFAFEHPAYMRLGACERPKDFPLSPYAPWRRLLRGAGPTLVIVGPLAGSILDALQGLDAYRRPSLWVLTELPVSADTLPEEFLADLVASDCLFVIEEHVAHGGAGQMLVHALAQRGRTPRKFVHRFALGYVSGRYGSQRFHRKECGLDPASIAAEVRRICS